MAKTRANGALHQGVDTSAPSSKASALAARHATSPADPVTATGAEWTLDAGRPREILERLLDRPDAARLVRQTPVQPLYLFVRALGLADAGEILALCTPEQIQAFIDLDGWERDHVQPQRLFLWLQALRELGHERFSAHLRRLDAELLTSLIGPRVRVYELNDEDNPPPEEPEGLTFATPDRMFLIDILPDPEADAESEADRALLVRSLLEDLYRGDLELARAVVMAARWDLGAETEERAYRFRSGRMADLGYIDYYEALKVYVLVDPSKPPVPEATRPARDVPAAAAWAETEPEPSLSSGGLIGPRSAVWRELVPRLHEPDFTFGRAVALLPTDEQARVLSDLLLLSNQVMAADRVELGDLEATRHSLQRVAGYLSLGLEFRLRTPGAGPETKPDTKPDLRADAKIDLNRAATLLQELPLLYLFRLGHSLTVQLRKLAGILVQSGLTTLVPKEEPGSLLPPEWAGALAHLLRVRPLYPLALEPDAPPPGSADSEVRPAPESTTPPAKTARPFGSLRELGRAAAFLERLGQLDRFFTAGLGLRKETLAATLRTTTPGARTAQLTELLGTILANALLDRPAALVPLARRDLPELQKRARGSESPGGEALSAAVRTRAHQIVHQRIHERAVSPDEEQQLYGADTRAFVDQSLDRLARGLAALPSPLPPDQADAVPAVPGLILT